MFSTKIESGTAWASIHSRPSVTRTATPPTASGIPAATAVPNASASTMSAAGMPIDSARRRSADVASWMSSKTAGAPVTSTVYPGGGRSAARNRST